MLKLNATYAGGIQQAPSSDGVSAREIQNLDYDFGQRCWTNKLGWISYWENPETSTASVASIFHWSPRGRLDRTLFEYNAGDGTLTLAYLAPYEAGGKIEIERGRHIPSVQEIGTTYATWGDYIFYANGYDGLRKWRGLGGPSIWTGPLSVPFGFQVRPSPPNVVDTEDDGFSGVKTGPGTYDWQGFRGWNESFTKVVLPENSDVGLGDPTADSKNAYHWRVSFITDTGSESPLSIPSDMASWVNGNTEEYDNNDPTAIYPGRYGIQLTNIPIGPPGTIKRRLYRTKNLGVLTGTADEESYYFVDDIPNNFETCYTDIIADAQLGSLGPTELESTILPNNLKFIATFSNRIVVGGGNSYPSRIFFSRPYRPEQFGVQDFIELGTRAGGSITGFVPYNDLLLIFRERGIDALVPTGDPNSPFYATPVYQTLGTVATKGAQVIAGLGVLFVAADGVYQFAGNFSGGSQPSLVKISDPISDIWDRVSVSSLAKAAAVWDGANSTYVLSVPVDGNSYTSLVLKYNILLGAWTTATDIPMACATIGAEGNIIFGTNTDDIGGIAPTSVGVICETAFAGYDIDGETYVTKEKPPASWTSGWLDFGDPDATKAIKSVSIECYSTHGLLLVEAGKDWEYDFPYSIPSEQIQPDGGPLTQWNIASWDATDAKYQNRRLAKVRYDIELPDVRFFRFKATTVPGEASQVKLIGYSVFYDVAGEPMAWSQAFDYFGAPSNNQKVNPSKIPQ